MIVHDEHAGPFVEAVGSVEVPLAPRLSLSLAAVARAVIPDEIGAAPDPDDALEPRPLAPLAATLQVGLSWELDR
jgi:hypothetical protein